jgi:competence protein ComEA
MLKLRHILVSLFLLLWSLVVMAASVDINQAGAKLLATTLDGVGPQKAAAIVAYRESNGPFRKIEDLAKVKGIGAATVAKNREKIFVTLPGEAQ